MYCKNCGKKIDDKTVFCNHCGSQIKENTDNALSTSGKTKVSAIVLSVLFGFFGWLYTYGKNKHKFWISVAVTFFLVTGVLTWGSIFANAFSTLISFGIWLWAILDNALKPNSFYKNYPN